jgi:hypothetical protein
VWPKVGVEEGGQEGEGKEMVALLTHTIGSIITPYANHLHHQDHHQHYLKHEALPGPPATLESCMLMMGTDRGVSLWPPILYK